MIGKTISHYTILEKLGEGGMGIVYKAHDTTLDRVVALKFLPHYLVSDSGEKERFYHEARAASALNHSNITTIYEIAEHDNQLYIAMEFIEGRTLKQLIEHDPLPMKKLLDIAIQICDGLVVAHEKRVVHRDIKSDNIMITPKGQVKIMDFGLAKVKGATKLTKAGSTLGTAAYMSPEQAQGEGVDHRSDIFSFGVVLYELIATKLPFRGEHQAALMYSLINEDPQPLARFNETVTPEIERIVAKALAKDPADRYQHIDEMLADLRRERKNLEYAKAGYATSVSQSTVHTVPSPRWKLRTKIILAAAGIVLAGALVVLFNPFNFQISMQKSSATPEKSTLAVMYFEDIPDPDDKDHTGEMLTNLLTTALFQVKDLQVVSRERLYGIETELGQGDSKSIPPKFATKVAERAGVSMMLLGTILEKEPSLAITYRLIEVRSGNILSTQRLAGFSKEKIFTLVDTLALLVKNDLHVSPTEGTDTKSVAEVTTNSPEAYRSFVEGIDLMMKYSWNEARGALRQAIELDSNFAMAYFSLAIIDPRIGEFTEGTTALRRAYQLSSGVSEREQLEIRALYAEEIEYDPSTSVQLLEELIRKYPREKEPYVPLCRSYFGNFFDSKNAIRVLQTGLKLDPQDKNLWNLLSYAYGATGHRPEALDAIEHYITLAPGEPNPYDSKGDLYMIFGEKDTALAWYKKAIAIRSDYGSAQPLGYDAMDRGDYALAADYFSRLRVGLDYAPIVAFHRGEFGKARTLVQQDLQKHQRDERHDLMDVDYSLMMLADYTTMEYHSMLTDAESKQREASRDPTDRIAGRPSLAWAFAKNGDPDKMQQTVRELQDLPGIKTPIGHVAQSYLSGLLDFEQGRYGAAIADYEEGFKTFNGLSTQPQFMYAVSLLKMGRLEEAVKELQRVSEWYPTGYTDPAAPFLPGDIYASIATVRAHYWLGVAYEQSGKRMEAVAEYKKFLAIWKDADFKSSELEDAKARLAKLKGAL